MGNCRHLVTRMNVERNGLKCVSCGEIVFKFETRQCSQCLHYDEKNNVSICKKKFMHVTKDMNICFKVANGTCFEQS